jgi:hypothetical protein
MQGSYASLSGERLIHAATETPAAQVQNKSGASAGGDATLPTPASTGSVAECSSSGGSPESDVYPTGDCAIDSSTGAISSRKRQRIAGCGPGTALADVPVKKTLVGLAVSDTDFSCALGAFERPPAAVVPSVGVNDGEAEEKTLVAAAHSLEDFLGVAVARRAAVLGLRRTFAELVGSHGPLNSSTKTGRSCQQVGLFEGLSGLFARWQFQEQERAAL